MKLSTKVSFTLLVFLAAIHKSYAVCQLCTIVAISGLGLSRYFGVDDTIAGVWIGALLISSALWTNNILKMKNIKFPLRKSVIIFSFYALTILPLYWMDMIGIPYNKLWHVDKVLLGIFVGTLLFLLGVLLDLVLRALNDCKVYFYFQKVILPISFIILATLIFYIIT